MGRYGGPHFEVDHENVVSIWVAIRPLEEIPDDYFAENYGGEDDDPFNQFCTDFGFGMYDHDRVETYCADDWKSVNISELIAPLSYARSFHDAAVRVASQKNLATTPYVFLIYNFKYDPAVTGIETSQFMRFLGSFAFSEGD